MRFRDTTFHCWEPKASGCYRVRSDAGKRAVPTDAVVKHSLSRDILGFSSFFLRTESMRTRSCLKMTAIFTGACGEKRAVEAAAPSV